MAKTTARGGKPKAKATRTIKPARGKITSNTVTFRLTPAEVKQAKACLARSGEIRYSFSDVRITKLPHVLDDGKQID